MQSFQHVSPAFRLFHGPDSLKALGSELDRVGSRRAVIFCGGSVSREATGLVLVRSALGERCVGVFDKVLAHSPLPTVRDGMKALADAEADAVVVLGGGSAIVTARAATILLAEGDDARRLSTSRGADGKMHSPRLTKAKLPQFVIPTTPTTACVKAGSAVFDTDTGRRLALFDPKTRAQALFIHPRLALSAPTSLVQSASLNTLTMAVEGLESESGDPLSDALLMHSLRMLAEHLPQLARCPDDGTLRGQLILAAMLCGQGTDFAGGGIAAVLSHSIGSRFNLNNGLIGAIVLPHTMRFNAEAIEQRGQKIAMALRDGPPNGSNCETAAALVEKLLDTLDIPRRLSDMGVTQDIFPAIADDAMLDWFLQSNPRRIEAPATISRLLQNAW